MPVAKKTDLPTKMTVDEFLPWAEQKEGRWELHDGVPVRLHNPLKGQSERARHVRAKGKILLAMSNALRKADVKCEALLNGLMVRIDQHVSYEPDAVVYCGERLSGDDLEVPDPLIIVEVLSPSTAYKDVGDKLADYFKLVSVVHYLVIDPKNSHIMHHYREQGEVKARAVNGAKLHLDPPGLDLVLDELFA